MPTHHAPLKTPEAPLWGLKVVALGSAKCPDSDGQGPLGLVTLVPESLYLPLTQYLCAAMPSPSILHTYPESKHCGPIRLLNKALSSPPCQATMHLLLPSGLPTAPACLIPQTLVPSGPFSQPACLRLGQGGGWKQLQMRLWKASHKSPDLGLIFPNCLSSLSYHSTASDGFPCSANQEP